MLQGRTYVALLLLVETPKTGHPPCNTEKKSDTILNHSFCLNPSKNWGCQYIKMKWSPGNNRPFLQEEMSLAGNPGWATQRTEASIETSCPCNDPLWSTGDLAWELWILSSHSHSVWASLIHLLIPKGPHSMKQGISMCRRAEMHHSVGCTGPLHCQGRRAEVNMPMP